MATVTRAGTVRACGRRRLRSRSPGRAAAAVALAGVAAALLVACTGPATPPAPTATTTPATTSPATAAPTGSTAATTAATTLRAAAGDRLALGVAATYGVHHTAAGDEPDPFGTDQPYRDLLAAQFSSLTPENQMKWAVIHPEPDQYDFAPADEVVAFAREHGQQVRGHTLVWYRSNPSWLSDGTFTDDELRQVLHDHVTTVVGHFAGQVAAWDVANEVFDATGALRTDTPFVGRLGVEAIADAFRWAHQADPGAVLYLNDFGLEADGPKLTAYLDLARRLLDEGVPLGGIGFQGHLSLEYPFSGTALASAMARFAALGLDVAVTELDVRIPLSGGVATTDQLAAQADVYRQVVRACLSVDRCVGITLWGVPDTYSWVPSEIPGEGAATPWADLSTPKPAYAAMLEALAG